MFFSIMFLFSSTFSESFHPKALERASKQSGVARVETKSGHGTAFRINPESIGIKKPSKDLVYMMSCAHVFSDLVDGDSFSVFFEVNGKELTLKGFKSSVVNVGKYDKTSGQGDVVLFTLDASEEFVGGIHPYAVNASNCSPDNTKSFFGRVVSSSGYGIKAVIGEKDSSYDKKKRSGEMFVNNGNTHILSCETFVKYERGLQYSVKTELGFMLKNRFQALMTLVEDAIKENDKDDFFNFKKDWRFSLIASMSNVDALKSEFGGRFGIDDAVKKLEALEGKTRGMMEKGERPFIQEDLLQIKVGGNKSFIRVFYNRVESKDYLHETSGMSGGPVVDEKGCVIGVVVSGTKLTSKKIEETEELSSPELKPKEQDFSDTSKAISVGSRFHLIHDGDLKLVLDKLNSDKESEKNLSKRMMEALK